MVRYGLEEYVDQTIRYWYRDVHGEKYEWTSVAFVIVRTTVVDRGISLKF